MQRPVRPTDIMTSQGGHKPGKPGKPGILREFEKPQGIQGKSGISMLLREFCENEKFTYFLPHF